MIQYSIHNLWSHYSNLLQHYRVFARERIEVGFLNPSVFGLFLMFWAFFDHSILAIFHSGTFRAYMIEKKFKNLILKKIVKLRRGSGKDWQGMAVKAKGLKA